MLSQTLQAMLLDKQVSQLVLVQCLGLKHDTEDATSSQVLAWCSRLCKVQAVNTYARMNANQEWGPPLKSASLDLVLNKYPKINPGLWFDHSMGAQENKQVE